MAEQEACASAVTEALGAAGAGGGSTDGGDARGESLLLPLLQGLLGGGGERLLAGLGAAPADVVSDVRRSLARLRAALAPPADHPQARALLQLADRLEDALDAADRLDGCRRRPRRRSRANRHTVGVTHEELAEARRLVDRGDLALAPDPPATSAGDETALSHGPSSDATVGYHDAVAARQRAPPIAHSVSYEPPAVASQPPAVERRAPGSVPRRPDHFRHSVADAAPQPQPQWFPRMERRPSETKSSIAAIANKFDSNAQMERQQVSAAPRRAPVVQAPRAAAEPQRSYFRPLPPTYNFAAPPTSQDDSRPLGRYGNNKKLRMKRANTIDIGKPLGGYRLDSDTDEETAPRPAPAVPEFRPQTENDKKFVAFMKKNEANDREMAAVGRANWSNRFGNIKNAFESREREEPSARSSSASSSSARRFWRAAEETGAGRLPADSAPESIKPPWVTERREPPRAHAPQLPRHNHPPRAPMLPHHPALVPHPAPPVPASFPPPPSFPAQVTAPVPPPSAVPQSPTSPLVVKPFVARPIPVNQFSHAPMSAFKPPAKVASPTTAPPYIWSPPSLSAAASPSAEHPPAFPLSPRATATSPPPPAQWHAAEANEPRETVCYQNGYESRSPAPPSRPPAYDPAPPPPPTHAPPPPQSYPVKAIPSQNNLAAPELVRRAGEVDYTNSDLPEVDAQKLQIEFYERQIREKIRREPPPARPAEPDTKATAPPAYTVTDYTPTNGVSTFVPLQRTPDIEKARAHKIDYLPDVVTNETDRRRSPHAPRAPPAPRSPRPQAADLPPAYRNGDAHAHGTPEEATTEHEMAVTRVMRGPVRGAATVTAGVRTRHEPAAADALRGALGKLSSPKRDAFSQKKREAPRSQVRALVQNGRSPPPVPHVRPSPPSLGASRESVASSGSIASVGSGLSRSGSWHQIGVGGGGKATSPRRVVARTKSMHLLAVPKMFEGGIAQEEMTEKRRTVEAYFAGAGPTAAPTSRSPARRQTRAPQYALGRSRTMSALTDLQFLDESNADDAFEDLVSALA